MRDTGELIFWKNNYMKPNLNFIRRGRGRPPKCPGVRVNPYRYKTRPGKEDGDSSNLAVGSQISAALGGGGGGGSGRPRGRPRKTAIQKPPTGFDGCSGLGLGGPPKYKPMG